MRDDVIAVLQTQYQKASNWQTSKNIKFDMTFEEFVSLWSVYRIRVLGDKIDKGRLDGYLNDPEKKPVCGWRTREDRASGVMTKNNACIDVAHMQLMKFRPRPGEKLSEETKKKMRKPKSNKAKLNMSKPKSTDPEAVARRAEGQRKRRERERNERNK